MADSLVYLLWRPYSENPLVFASIEGAKAFAEKDHMELWEEEDLPTDLPRDLTWKSYGPSLSTEGYPSYTIGPAVVM